MNIYRDLGVRVLEMLNLNTIACKIREKDRNLWLDYIIPALCVSLFIVFVVLRFNHTPYTSNTGHLDDFQKAYYPAGRLILENPSKLYNSYLSVAGFVNIPIVALLFSPLVFLDEFNAGLLFTILGVLSTIAYSFLIVKLTNVSGWRRTIVFGLLATNTPLYNSINMGNTSHFLLLLLLGVLFCNQSKRQIWMGVLLAAIALIKPPLAMIIAYFIVRKRWRVVGGFAATILAIAGTSLLLFGVDLHVSWFQNCIQPFAGKAIGAYNVQSVDSFLVRFLTNDNVTNWELLELGANFRLLRYLLFSILIGSTVWTCWKSKTPTTLEVENLELSIFLCLALLISPISWMHYYSLFLLPLCLYVSNKLAIPKGWLWSGFMLLSTLLLILPPIKKAGMQNPALRFFVFNFGISHFFFGGVLLLGIMLAARWYNSKHAQLSLKLD